MATKKKSKIKKLTDDNLVAIRDTARHRKPLDGQDLHTGIAVMYVDAQILESMAHELIQRRKQD